MLPPIDFRVLERNPNFEVLYKDLTARKLNPDGSTRDTKKQRIHDEIRRSLADARINLVSSQTLIQSLSDLPSRTTDLPPEIHSVIEIVSAQLSGHVPESDREILSGDVDFFIDNLTTVSDAISSQLCIMVKHLSKIVDPKSPPAISSLSSTAAAIQQNATFNLPRDLATARIDLTNTMSALLTTHLSLLSTSIRILEQTQHGALARHTKSSAELLHARATVLGLQAKLHTFAHPPPPEFVAALKEYKKAQGTGEKALKDREALARRELELYEKAGGKGMRDLAGRKVWLESEIRNVEGEIEKLGNGS
ncbi:hypothetical protein BDU57DRAFT_557231 [Ampelomyces quisqualis]|uniref:HAUS augmin-like complex subunit 4-domain-containing protein n=1 Tax=Ampelomyces quisqualis TaxID=50730 RepID=A0A6A5QQU3_AMPQU|nr:hypothetical protein BDU57DRAFT_557231 [Ampelomyces quisqualis]